MFISKSCIKLVVLLLLAAAIVQAAFHHVPGKAAAIEAGNGDNLAAAEMVDKSASQSARAFAGEDADSYADAVADSNAVTDEAVIREHFIRLAGGEAVMQAKRVPSFGTGEVAGRGTVYLSFDDGPSPLTERVLAILKEEQVPATFFILGQAAETYPDIVKNIHANGHAIGNHTYNHNYEQLYENFKGYWQQIQQTEHIIQALTGETPQLVRTPGGTHGHLDPFYDYLMDLAGYRIYDWNVDSGDSRKLGVPAADIVAAVKRAPLQKEMHILMHDSKTHAETVKALPDIIQYFKDEGYTFAKMTPETTPVRHSYGQLRHNRTMDWETFERLTAMVQTKPDKAASAKTRIEVLSPEAANRLPSDKYEAESDNAAPALTLSFPGRSITLPADQYALIDGHFHVPLRTVHEAVGGKVYWDAENKTARAQMGLRFIDYDVRERTVTETFYKHHKMKQLPGLSLYEGTLMVPLREWVSQMGFHIEDFTMNAQERRVNIGFDV